VVPEELHSGVDVDSYQSDCNESEEHLEHCEYRGLVVDLFSCPLVDKLQHLVGSDVSVGVADAPLELLNVHLLLYVTHHRHVRLRNSQIRSSLETKFLINWHQLIAEGHLGEKGRILVRVDGSHIFIKVD